MGAGDMTRMETKGFLACYLKNTYITWSTK